MAEEQGSERGGSTAAPGSERGAPVGYEGDFSPPPLHQGPASDEGDYSPPPPDRQWREGLLPDEPLTLADAAPVRFGSPGGATPEPDSDAAAPEIDVGQLSVGERLYYVGCGVERCRQERLRTERQLGVLREVSQLAPPQITALARQLYADREVPPLAERALMWRRRIDHKNERQKRQEEAEAAAAPLPRHVNPHSEDLVGPQYGGPVRAWGRHVARYLARKNAQPEPGVFAPCINPSASFARRGAAAVEQRLYKDAAERADRRRHLREAAAERECIDPDTSLPLFVPNAGRAPGAAGPAASPSRAAPSSSPKHSSAGGTQPPRPRARCSPVRGASASPSGRPHWKAWAAPPPVPGARAGWDAPPAAPLPAPGPSQSPDATVASLLSRGQEAQLRRRRLEHRLHHGQYPFAPRLNPDSIAAASNIPRRPLHEDRRERFCGKRCFSSPRNAAAAAAAGARGEKGHAKRSTVTPEWEADFLRRNSMLAVRRRERVDTLKQEIARQELVGCTFAPSLCKNSDGIRAGAVARERRQRSAASRSRSFSPPRPHFGVPPSAGAATPQRAASMASPSPSPPRRQLSPQRAPPPAPAASPPPRAAPGISGSAWGPGELSEVGGLSAEAELEVERVLAEWGRLAAP
eukprot:TRINITY_DN1167_c5_g1_i1.p1 TRINITY_DN1167_c5_g1~~TRINITY_DN1167_c5_g1_i1.p1  ORF type:complete len:659 (+),score=193.33 TRINITY_DN1167_c5_g1_i1:69-1979(+)